MPEGQFQNSVDYENLCVLKYVKICLQKIAEFCSCISKTVHGIVLLSKAAQLESLLDVRCMKETPGGKKLSGAWPVVKAEFICVHEREV